MHFPNYVFFCLSWCLAVFIYVFGGYICVRSWPVLQRRSSNVSSFSAWKNYVWVSLTIIALTKETLPNWVLVCSVCSWVAGACEKWRKQVVVRFQSVPTWNVTIVCLRYNSIHHSHRVPVPSAFRNPWIFASSWFRGLIWDLSCFFVNATNFKARSIFCFLNLSYIKDWSEKYSPYGAFATPDV